MNDYDEIRNLLENYILSLEKRDAIHFMNLFDQSMEARFSNIGSFKDASLLFWHLIFDEKINFQKNDICNLVIRVDQQKAVMSAYVMSLIGIDDGTTFFPFQFGGKYVFKMKKDTKWKIKEILYDLDWYKGNSSFVDNWKLIDYKAFAGHAPMIISEIDSPWAQIKVKQNVPDEYLIKETLFKYSFGLDNCDFSLHKSSYVDDIKFFNGDKLAYKNSREILMDFKRLNHKEHTLEHAIKVCDVQVMGDHAILHGLRIEPHRIGSKNINIETKENSFFSAQYECYFIKRDDEWKMYEIHYLPKIKMYKEKRFNHFVDDMKEIKDNV